MTDVVHIITGLGLGGAEAMLVQIATALQARGLTQHVISLSALDTRVAELEKAGVKVSVPRAGTVASSAAVVLSLLRTVNAAQPRVVQGWMYHGNLAASFSHRVCRGARHRKLMWNLRASNMDATRYGRVIRWNGFASRAVDVVVANSQAGIDFHAANGFHPRRFTLIANGIDTASFRPDAALRESVRAELGLPADAVVAIHVARVDAMKDHAMFLSAMARMPSIIGVLVGEGTTKFDLPPNVRALGLRRDIGRLYAGADLIALTSAFGEGFSNVTAEGMSAGLLPVVTDVGDARRIVGDTGWIVPPGDVAGFTAALGEAIALPATERQRRGQAARDRIEANFSVSQAVDAYAKLYGI